MIPSEVIVDLSGPRRLRAVRIIDGVVYGERRQHPNGADTSDEQIVRLDVDVSGAVVEIRRNRWTVGEWNVVKSSQCSCGGRNRALRAWAP